VYSISALRSFTLVLSDDLFYVTYTTEFPLGGPDYQVKDHSPSHVPDDRGICQYECAVAVCGLDLTQKI
jgi:hypothetical protein